MSICGPVGAGKTRLTKLLVDRLGTDVAVRVPGDRYLVPAQESLDEYFRRPVRYDWELLGRALAVPSGTVVHTPSFDFRRFVRRAEPDRRPFITRPVLIVDAIEPYPAATVRVYIDAPVEVRKSRVVRRDAARGSRSADRWAQLELSQGQLERRGLVYDIVLAGTDGSESNADTIVGLLAGTELKSFALNDRAEQLERSPIGTVEAIWA